MPYEETMAQIQFNDTELFQLCLHSKFGSAYPHYAEIKQLPRLKIEVFELLSEEGVEMRVYRKSIKENTPFSLSEKLFIEDSLGKGCCENNFIEKIPQVLNDFLTKQRRIPDYVTLKYIQKKMDIVFLVQYESIERVLHKILEEKKGQLGFESCRSLFMNLLAGMTYPTFLEWNNLERYFKHWESKNFSYDYFTFLEVIFALEADKILEIETIDLRGLQVPIFKPENVYRYQLKDDYFFYVNSGMLMKLRNKEEPIAQFEDKNSYNYLFLKEFSERMSKGVGLSFEDIALIVYKRKEYKAGKEVDSIRGLLKRLRSVIQKSDSSLEGMVLFPTENEMVTGFY